MSSLPFFTRPIASGQLTWRVSVTLVSSPKALTSCRLVFFNFHVRIAKTNSLGLVTFFGNHYELLRATWGAFRFVVTTYTCSG